jgi:hypothetical protein
MKYTAQGKPKKTVGGERLYFQREELESINTKELPGFGPLIYNIVVFVFVAILKTCVQREETSGPLSEEEGRAEGEPRRNVLEARLKKALSGKERGSASLIVVIVVFD